MLGDTLIGDGLIGERTYTEEETSIEDKLRYLARTPVLFIESSQKKWLIARTFTMTENLNKSGQGTVWLSSSEGPISAGDEVFVYCLSYGYDRLFGGRVKEVEHVHNRIGDYEYQLLLQDYSYHITDVKGGTDNAGDAQGVVYELADTMTENELITDLLDNFAPDVPMSVYSIEGEDIEPGDVEWGGVNSDFTEYGADLFLVINEVAALHNRYWSVGVYGQLYYIDYLTPLDSDPIYTDTPNYTNSFPYSNLRYSTDYYGNKIGSFDTFYGIIHPGQSVKLVNSVEGWDGVTTDEGLFLCTQVVTNVINGIPKFTISFGSPWLYVENN